VDKLACSGSLTEAASRPYQGSLLLENLGRRPGGLQQGGNEDVGVENDADHEPGCGRVWRRAFRAAAISASISSPES
jgi:hypothetical protein